MRVARQEFLRSASSEPLGRQGGYRQSRPEALLITRGGPTPGDTSVFIVCVSIVSVVCMLTIVILAPLPTSFLSTPWCVLFWPAAVIMGDFARLLGTQSPACRAPRSCKSNDSPDMHTAIMLALGASHSYGEVLPLGSLGASCRLWWWTLRYELLRDKRGVCVERSFYGEAKSSVCPRCSHDFPAALFKAHCRNCQA